MKKFAIIVFMGIVFIAQAQSSLKLSYPLGSLQPDDTVTFYCDTGQYSTITAYIYVTNTTGSDLWVKVKKTEISVIPGSENTFCWGQCYLPTVYVSPQAVLIPSHGTDETSFWGEYHPNGQLGTSIIRYTFFVEDTPNDSVAIYVKYTATPTSLLEESTPNIVLYPNPGSSIIYFKTLPVSSDAEIVFTNSLGKIISRVSLSSFPLDITSWPAGTYFYHIVKNSRISSSQKFIVIK